MQNLILNRYRPLEEAGSGGFGTVVAAWDTRIQRRVAIKCLKLDAYGTAADPTVPRDMPGLEEARTAAMLTDPHIVGVYDFEAFGSQAYLIMEYVDGVTLSQLMEHFDGPLPLNIATCVFESVAAALKVAHDNQVLHLDIKPDNVLINRQGQVKVSDFGLAQLSHEAGFGQAAGGTIGYMPLEQMRLEAPDVRTDEWALAALTYEMLTGDNPFRAPSLAAAERAIEEAEVIIPSAVRSDVDEELDEAIFGALSIDRDERFDSVELFAEAMLPHMGNAARGARELTVVVGDAPEIEDEEFEDEDADVTAELADGVGLGAENDADEGALDPTKPVRVRDRGPREPSRAVRFVFMRVWACVACAFVGYVAGMNMPLLEELVASDVPSWAVTGVCAVAGAVWPVAGVLVSLVALVVALLMREAFACAIVLAVLGGAWWSVCARHDAGAANAGISVASAGAFGFAGLAPLLAGAFSRVRDAVLTAAFSAVLAFVLACSGSGALAGWNMASFGLFPSSMDASAAELVFDASMWVVAVSWVAAAVLVALCCGRGRRGLAVAGMVGAVAILVVGLAAVSVVSGGTAWTIGLAPLARTLIAGVIMVALCALDVPTLVRA